MKLFTKQEALDRMNLLGKSGKPFLFIIDYETPIEGGFKIL